MRQMQYQALAAPVLVVAAITGAVSTHWDGPPLRNIQFQYQSVSEPVPVTAAEVVTVDKWISPLSGPSRTIKRVSGDISSVPFNQVSIDGWGSPFSEPLRAKKRLSNEISYVPTTQAPVVDVGLGWLSQSNQPVASGFSVIDLSSVFIASTEELLTYEPWSQPTRKKPALRDVGQPFVPFVAPAPDVVTEDKWHYQWSLPVRQRPGLGVYQQPFAFFDPYPRPVVGAVPVRWDSVPSFRQFQYQSAAQPTLTPAPEIITVDKWFAQLSTPVRKPPAAQQQQTLAAPIAPVVAVVVNVGWLSPWAQPSTSGVSVIDLSSVFIASTEVLQTYQPWSEPSFKKRVLRDVGQPFVPFIAAPEVVTEDKWHYSWSLPVRKKPGLAVSQQPFAFFNPYPIVVAGAVPVAWSNVPSHRQFQYQVSVVPEFTQPPAVGVIGWYGWLSEPVRVKPGLLTARQRAFDGPDRTLANPVFVTMAAIEDNRDVFSAGIEVFNGASRAVVSIEEISAENDAALSIREP